MKNETVEEDLTAPPGARNAKVVPETHPASPPKLSTQNADVKGEETLSEYNPWACPPDFDMARRHA